MGYAHSTAGQASHSWVLTGQRELDSMLLFLRERENKVGWAGKDLEGVWGGYDQNKLYGILKE